MGWRRISGFGSRRSSQSRPCHGDAPVGSILSNRRVLPSSWSKHSCRAISVRVGRVDVDLVRLRFSLAIHWKPTGWILSGHAPHPFGAVLILCQAMPLLRAQYAFDLLALLDFFQNEIGARLRSFRSRGGPSLSQPSVWNCTCRGARRLELYLSSIFNPTPLDLVCCACDRTLNVTLARAFIA